VTGSRSDGAVRADAEDPLRAGDRDLSGNPTAAFAGVCPLASPSGSLASVTVEIPRQGRCPRCTWERRQGQRLYLYLRGAAAGTASENGLYVVYELRRSAEPWD